MQISFVGNVGQDAEIKTSKHDNKTFVRFSVAVNDGTGVDKVTTWFSCTTPFEKLAKHLTKGSKVTVMGGRLSINKGDDGRIFYNVNGGEVVPTWLEKDAATSAPALTRAPAASQYDDHSDIPF